MSEYSWIHPPPDTHTLNVLDIFLLLWTRLIQTLSCYALHIWKTNSRKRLSQTSRSFSESRFTVRTSYERLTVMFPHWLLNDDDDSSVGDWWFVDRWWDLAVQKIWQEQPIRKLRPRATQDIMSEGTANTRRRKHRSKIGRAGEGAISLKTSVSNMDILWGLKQTVVPLLFTFCLLHFALQWLPGRRQVAARERKDKRIPTQQQCSWWSEGKRCHNTSFNKKKNLN